MFLPALVWSVALGAASAAPTLPQDRYLSECEKDVLPLDALPEESAQPAAGSEPIVPEIVFFEGARATLALINKRRLEDALANRARSGSAPAQGPLAPEKFPLRIDQSKNLVRGVFVHSSRGRGFKIQELPLNKSGDVRRVEVRPTTDPLMLLILGYSGDDDKPYRIVIGTYCYKVPTNKNIPGR